MSSFTDGTSVAANALGQLSAKRVGETGSQDKGDGSGSLGLQKGSE
jgi:hypothetical protein